MYSTIKVNFSPTIENVKLKQDSGELSKSATIGDVYKLAAKLNAYTCSNDCEFIYRLSCSFSDGTKWYFDDSYPHRAEMYEIGSNKHLGYKWFKEAPKLTDIFADVSKGIKFDLFYTVCSKVTPCKDDQKKA